MAMTFERFHGDLNCADFCYVPSDLGQIVTLARAYVNQEGPEVYKHLLSNLFGAKTVELERLPPT